MSTASPTPLTTIESTGYSVTVVEEVVLRDAETTVDPSQSTENPASVDSDLGELYATDEGFNVPLEYGSQLKIVEGET